MKPSADNLPVEIIFHILSFVNHAELIAASYVCRQWHAATAPWLATLQTHAHTLSDKSLEEILTTCQHSLPALQAIMMSGISNRFSEAQLLQLALTTYQHAETILKSRFIHKHIATKSPHQLPSPPTGTEIMTEAQILEIFVLNIEDLLTSKELTNTWDNQQRAQFLLTLASHNLRYTTLVLYHGIYALSGFNLMKVAIQSVAHAKQVLKQANCLARLKPGHLMDIGQSSPEHARLIIRGHLNNIGREGVKQIVQKGPDYGRTVIHVALQLLVTMPYRLAHSQPSTTKWVVAHLINKTFYTSANPFWEKYRVQNPQQAQSILLLMACLNLDTLKYIVNQIIITLMGLSSTHTQDILTLTTIGKRLSLEGLNSLKAKGEDYHQRVTAFLETTPLPPSVPLKLGFNF